MKILQSLSSVSSLDVQERLRFAKNTVAIFLVIGILLSIQVWIPNRFFPMFPVFEWLKVPSFIDVTLLVALITSLLAGVISDKIIITRCAFISLLILLLLDQMRWQPWVYLYLVILFPYTYQARKFPFSVLNCLQLVIIGVYFWSGIQKFNQNFIDNTFNNILTLLFGIEDRPIIDILKVLGYSIPLIEVSVGVMLVIPKFRGIGVYMSILTHLFILAYLSPLGIDSNSVVYPWNIAMIVLVTLLFFRMKNPLTVWNFESLQMKFLNLAVILFIWILPLFNFIKLWDNYLSFSLYSDRLNRYYIAIEQNEVSKLDKRLHNYFVNITGLSGGQIIDVDKWSIDVLNVPFYPERRIFNRLGGSFCELGIEEGKIIFLEIQQPLHRNKLFKFTCKDIE